MPSRLRASFGTPAVAAVAYLALAVLWAAPSSLSPTEVVPDVGDPLHLAYVMAWDAHQLVRHPLELFDANSFHPYPRSLAFGDHLLPEALSVAPIFWATGNAVLASNVAVLLALTLSAFTMFLLVRQITGCGSAAFLAGLLYAFNTFTRHELPRVHVLNLQWWPLALLCLDRFARSGLWKDARGFAAMAVLQGLSGAYYLVSTAVLVPIWLVTAWAAGDRRPAWADARRVVAGFALAGIPASLVLWPYVLQLRSFGFAKPLAEGADLVCYVEPAPESWLWGGLHVFGGCFGLPHFAGFAAAFLMLAGLALLCLGRFDPSWRVAGVVSAVTAAVGLALSLGPTMRVGGVSLGPGPFYVLYRLLPFVRGMDGSKRLGVLLILGGSVLAGLALARLLRTRTPPQRRILVAVLAVVIPLEHWTRTPPHATVPAGARMPAVYDWLAGEGRGAVAELPLYPEVSKRYWALYLYFSTHHFRPIPIGRTSFYPPAHDFLAFSLEDFPDATSLTLLDRLGIETIVVHPRNWPPEERAAKLEALEAEPALRLVRRFEGADPQFEALGLGDERVYRIALERHEPLRLCEPRDEIPRAEWSLRSLGAPRPEPASGERTRVRRAVRRSESARDGDARTAWTTDGIQRPGDGLRVELANAGVVAAAALDFAYPYDEFPRRLALAAEGGDDEHRRLGYADGPEERWQVLDALLHRPLSARWVLRVPPRELKILDLKISARDPDAAVTAWSVPELHLYRECR